MKARAVVFLVNAPIEEIVYRGWLQDGLAERHGITVAIVVQGTCLRPAAHHVRRRWAWHDHPRLCVLCVGCHSRRHRSQAAAIGADGDRPSLSKPAHLFIWDEPLNYIDVISRIQIEEIIKEAKPTLIFVEHDKRFVEDIANKVIQL